MPREKGVYPANYSSEDTFSICMSFYDAYAYRELSKVKDVTFVVWRDASELVNVQRIYGAVVCWRLSLRIMSLHRIFCTDMTSLG